MRADQGESLLALAITANKFGQRPSGILGILDEAIALDFDVAAARCLVKHENQMQTNWQFMAARLQAAMVWGRGSGEPSSNGESDGGAAQRRAAEFFG